MVTAVLCRRTRHSDAAMASQRQPHCIAGYSAAARTHVIRWQAMSSDLEARHGVPTGPRRNRVDPWGDLHAVPERGLFTGNRGCVVDDNEQVVRHHGSSLWISCQTEFRGWRWPLARPRRWTPLFFLDDAVALAAGHRPCATCRHEDYVSYRNAVMLSLGASEPLRAWQLNDRLNNERLSRGRGLQREKDRILSTVPFGDVPDGTVIVDDERSPYLVLGDELLRFTFGGWTPAARRPRDGRAHVLTPPTSVAALRHGFTPTLHPSAREASKGSNERS
jgi:hypothetical protein